MFDLTDPLGSSGSAQPLGYDQWKALYTKAYVLGCKVTVRVHNEGTVGVMFGITAMPESQGNTSLSDYNHLMELPSTKSRILSPEMDHSILTYSVNPAKHVGLKKIQDEDAFHVTLASETQPARTAYIHVWQQPLDKATTNNVEVVITAEYILRLYDPVIPARSFDT